MDWEIIGDYMDEIRLDMLNYEIELDELEYGNPWG